MAFPINDFVTDGISDQNVVKARRTQFIPEDLLLLRDVFIQKLFVDPEPGSNDQIALQISRLVQVTSRVASTESTAFDGTTANSSATSTSNTLTKQVERAFTQILGRAPGRSSDGFVTALNAAFPTGKDGRVTFTPVRSVVSLAGSATNKGNQGFNGQLSVEQASLYRQTSIIVADALSVLEGIQPFDPSADLDAVEALRSLIQNNLNHLIEEFGRIDEPRQGLVETYFTALRKNIDDLGDYALFNSNNQPGSGIGFTGNISQSQNGNGLIKNLVTAEDEAQVAAYELLKDYVNSLLRTAWDSYIKEGDTEKASNNYSERLSRVNVMLPVIAESIASVMDAMDSVGFTASERRADDALFSKLQFGPNSLGIPIFSDLTQTQKERLQTLLSIERGFGQRKNETLQIQEYALSSVSIPRITVNDFSEWVERFASLEAPSILSSSGRFGLDFVTDQADTLFWVIATVLDYLKINPSARGKSLGRILEFDRVKQSLIELVSQLKTLADLGVADSRFSA